MATIKLTELSTEYSSFVNDQVLTANQLNTLIDYFEDQNRLTRVCLSGVGIVCGLVPTIKGNEITVSRGCGVTTDGDLLKTEVLSLSMFKPFEDTHAQYEHFKGLTFFELFNAEEGQKKDAQSLSTLRGFSDMVAVLYLENYAKEATPCTSTDCDNAGQEQVANLKVLLISKEDAKKLTERDSIFSKFNKAEQFLRLPNLKARRVVLNALNTKTYHSLKDAYRSAIQNTGILDDLKKGILRLFTDFSNILNLSAAPASATVINNRIDALFGFNTKNIPLDIQYRYGLLKDLIDTYTEIRKLLLQVAVICCPEVSAFPKHLLLGELVKTDAYYSYRHSFYASPIISNGREKLEKAMSLTKRLALLLSEYKAPSSQASIVVTPSKNHNEELGKRAIPYYYQPNEQLFNHWNGEEGLAEEPILGYHVANRPNQPDDVKNPLDYNLDSYNFLRIEGHLGKDYRTAIRAISDIKTNKGLAFDIKALSIEETLDSINVDEYDCHFEDLNAVLRAWKAEQDCIMADIASFFSGFSTKAPGINKYYTLSKGLRQNLNDGNTLSLLTSVNTAKEEPVLSYSSMRAAYSSKIPFKETFTLNTVIDENLYKDEDVLGNIVEKAIKENPDGSANDIIASVKKTVDNDAEIATWDEEIREVAVKQPYELIAFSKVSTRFIPNSVREIEESKVNNYKISMKQLCDRVEAYKKRMTGLLYTTGSRYERKGYEQQYALLLNQLSVNCCAAKKMEVLLDEIKKRKEKLLQEKLLSKFIENHPALEHKAGVPVGGTFVLVYKGKTKPPALSLNLRDLILGGNLRLNLLTGKTATEKSLKETENLKSGIRTNIGALSEENFLVRDAVNLLDVRDLLGDFTLREPIENISENTVIADFSLPYLCCSDCAPVAFIVPKTVVSLRLPVQFVCSDHKEVLPFEVEPVGGIVTSDANNLGIVNRNGSFFFDVSQVTDNLYGKEIHFMVNGQQTDCKLTVYEKPVFDFRSSEPRYGRGNTFAEVTFTIAGDIPEGSVFNWDFGDGSNSDNRSQRNPTHTYKLPINSTNTVQVSATVTNIKCASTVTHEVKFEIATQSPCNSFMIESAEASLKELPKYRDLDARLVTAIYDPTAKLLEDFKGNATSYLNGDLNDTLISKFLELISLTARVLQSMANNQDSFEFLAISNLYRIQIQLLYAILSCQPPEAIEKHVNTIEQLMGTLNEDLKKLQSARLKVDIEGRLQEFFKGIAAFVKGKAILERNLKIQTQLI